MKINFVEETPMAGRERVVEPGQTVGRGGDIVLADPEASRHHATFRQVDGRPAVEDLGSRNGTFVNEQRATGITVLSKGDTVRFGNTSWRLEGGHSGGAARQSGQSDDRPPTAIRAAIPSQPVIGEAPQFRAARSPSPILGGSAARRVEATVMSYAVILATAAGIAYFFAQR